MPKNKKKIKDAKVLKLKALGDKIELKTRGNNLPSFGTSSGDLTDVPFSEVPMSSICAMLKWVYQNTGLRYEIIVGEIDFEGSKQGFNVYDEDNKLVNSFRTEATGGDNGDPATQLKIDTLKIINEIITFSIEDES